MGPSRLLQQTFGNSEHLENHGEERELARRNVGDEETGNITIVCSTLYAEVVRLTL